MKKLKVIMIAHASHSYFLEKGDDLKKLTLTDWYARTARQLKKFYPNLNVECWCPEKKYKKEIQFVDTGIKFRMFPTTFSPMYAVDFSFPMIKALKEEIKNNKNKGIKTIIHLHEYHNFHGLFIASFFKNDKIIAQHHGGSWPLKHIKQSMRYKLFFLLFLAGQVWENFALKNIKTFFVLSKDEEEYLKKKAKNSKIKFQTMGIDEDYFKKESKIGARKRLNLPIKDNILLYIGRINQIKGISFLLEAMKQLRDIKLKIIGFGPQEEEFRQYAKNQGLTNVEFVGAVFGKEKLDYLSAADALILPSLKEGAPVVIMEAIAKNLPVISTDVGGILLMMKNKREGIIIHQRSVDEIVKAVREILTWKNKNIAQYGKIYKWKKIIKDTVEEYEKV